MISLRVKYADKLSSPVKQARILLYCQYLSAKCTFSLLLVDIFQQYASISHVCPRSLSSLPTQPMHKAFYIHCFTLHGFDHFSTSRMEKPLTPFFHPGYLTHRLYSHTFGNSRLPSSAGIPGLFFRHFHLHVRAPFIDTLSILIWPKQI